MVVHTHQPQEHSKGCIVCLLLQNCSNAVPDNAHVEPLEVVMPGWTGVRVPHTTGPAKYRLLSCWVCLKLHSSGSSAAKRATGKPSSLQDL